MMVRDVAGLLVCNLLFCAAGSGLIRLSGGWRTPRGLARSVGIAYLAGIAAVGVALQLLLVLGAPFTRWVVVAVCGVFALSGLAARHPVDPPAHGVRMPAYLRPVVIVLVGIVALMAVDLWFQPLGVWDAWAQWTAKARSLVVFQGLNVDVFASAPYRPWNPDYPLLVPSVEAADFTFMRHVDTRAIHMQFWLVYAGFLLALLELLRGRAREVLIWPFVLAIALSPAVQIQTASALADVPVGVFFAMAGLFAWRWLIDADRLALKLFPVFAAGAFATKFEGRIYIAALSMTMIALIAVTARSRLVATLASVLAALIGLVPLSLWASHYHVVGTFSTSLRERLGLGLIDKADRIPLILEALARNVLDPSRWFLLGLVIVASLVVAWVSLPSRVGPWLVVGTLALVTLGLVLVYWATPLELHWHLRQSARRVVTGPMLFAIALVPLLLESALRARIRGTDGKQYPLRP
jgi:hypothetical protein